MEEAVPETANAGRRAPYRRAAEEVVAEFGSDPRRGLSAEEAHARLGRYGPNELQERGGKGPWSILWEQFTSVMVIVLVVAAIFSAALGDHEDAAAIAVIVVLNTVLGFSQEYRAEKAMAALKRLSAPTVGVRRDGHVREISAEELVPGEVVLLETGNL